MGDDLGIAPSNVGQGYVARKLIRRAIRHGRMVGINNNFTDKIGEAVIKSMREIYPELERNRKFILDNFKAEEEKFIRALSGGIKEAEKIFDKYLNLQGKAGMRAQEVIIGKKVNFSNPFIGGKEAFYLYSTKGLPVEVIKQLAEDRGFVLDEEGFEEEMKKHQELSRTAAVGKFKGGLGEMSEQAIKYHTATHLLQEALRRVLGGHVAQKGSNITDERLRFDFSHPEKMTAEQKAKVEKTVNQMIAKDLPVVMEEMAVDEAKSAGAIGLFGDKYGNKVKVYSIGDFSKEICGGPHAARTGVLGRFKIKKEEASSAGVRRIKAVLE